MKEPPTDEQQKPDQDAFSDCLIPIRNQYFDHLYPREKRDQYADGYNRTRIDHINI
jgi:hypothetical protein